MSSTSLVQTSRVESLLRTVASGAVTLQRDKVTWRVPIAAAAMTALTVSIFIALGWADKAIPVALGALFMPLSGLFEEPARRLRTQLWTLSWMMLTTLIGGLLSGTAFVQVWVAVAVSAIVAFCCGFAGGAGINARVGGVLALVLFAVFLGMPVPRHSAVQDCLLVGLGGLIVIGWLVMLRIVMHRHKSWGAAPVHPNVLARLRPRLNTRDDYFRHGIRLAGAFSTATALAALLKWPHQYWIPMTVAWVVVPDINGTATRVAARVLGTLMGIAVITIVVEGAHPGPYAIAIIVGIGALIAEMFVVALYLICVVGVTIFMIALFTLVGDPVGSTIAYRAISTILAGIITIAWSLVWPSVAHERRHRFRHRHLPPTPDSPA